MSGARKRLIARAVTVNSQHAGLTSRLFLYAKQTASLGPGSPCVRQDFRLAFQFQMAYYMSLFVVAGLCHLTVRVHVWLVFCEPGVWPNRLVGFL
jgi:hypothetical protein